MHISQESRNYFFISQNGDCEAGWLDELQGTAVDASFRLPPERSPPSRFPLPHRNVSMIGPTRTENLTGCTSKRKNALSSIMSNTLGRKLLHPSSLRAEREGNRKCITCFDSSGINMGNLKVLLNKSCTMLLHRVRKRIVLATVDVP